VNLDQAIGRTTGSAVEAIDVLREHPGPRLAPLQLGDGEVAGIGFGLQAGPADIGRPSSVSPL